MIDFSEVKEEILLQIQLGGGFSSPKTQKAREYLDALILAEEIMNNPLQTDPPTPDPLR